MIDVIDHRITLEAVVTTQPRGSKYSSGEDRVRALITHPNGIAAADFKPYQQKGATDRAKDEVKVMVPAAKLGDLFSCSANENSELLLEYTRPMQPRSHTNRSRAHGHLIVG
ncbi:hypothetical protein JB92DRAFT_3103234 [Gautieria morchelliformis]|nr:hypothetical protein JB92DRAFT_3103234 [Gautieria morchelliformis]